MSRAPTPALSAAPHAAATDAIRAASNDLAIVPFLHPQGCRTWLVADRPSRRALVVDPHADFVAALVERLHAEQWTLAWVVDTHTHADHPSGSAALAIRTQATRVAHPAARHRGVPRTPADGESLELGGQRARILHAPGHTPDSLVVVIGDALFAGDTLLIDGVARADFLGGDARALHDTLQRLLRELPDATRLFPGHDYAGRVESTLGEQKRSNPWLAERDREAFAVALSADPPPRPANMDELLRLNRDGTPIAAALPAAELVAPLAQPTASVVDVRTGAEFRAEHVSGARLIPLDELEQRADEVRALPAPRYLLCRTGARAAQAREKLLELGVAATTVVEGGIEALVAGGLATVKGRAHLSLERQVRIAAGALVLTGVAAALLLHPAFVALSAFVGAGLVFAGLTDWCGMGLLLARMPWNRVASAPEGARPHGGGCAAPRPSGGCAAPRPRSSAPPR
ncbi:MAG: MBL fold metallo-hydrolase [Planctomycetes bacterium]|nr:MBL fold metallo-hydrolase [Planctomycetota bacterium]